MPKTTFVDVDTGGKEEEVQASAPDAKVAVVAEVGGSSSSGTIIPERKKRVEFQALEKDDLESEFEDEEDLEATLRELEAQRAHLIAMQGRGGHSSGGRKKKKKKGSMDISQLAFLAACGAAAWYLLKGGV